MKLEILLLIIGVVICTAHSTLIAGTLNIVASEPVYTRLQVDSVVASEMRKLQEKQERQIENQVIKESQESLSKYIASENTRTNWAVCICTMLVTVMGVVIPLILTNRSEKKIQKQLDKNEKVIKQLVQQANGQIIKQVNASKKEIQGKTDNIERIIDQEVKETVNRMTLVQPTQSGEEKDENLYNLLHDAYGYYQEKKYSKAFELYLQAAEKGNATAQQFIGLMYENGWGTEKDLKKSAYWYEKSASQGNSISQCRMGQCFEYGIGVDRNIAKAISWYGLAANQNHAYAKDKYDELVSKI